MKAIYAGQVIAESDDTVVVENNHYFPPESLNKQFFSDSDTTTTCPWKGTANYFTVTVDGDVNSDAAWYYAETKDAANNIKGRVAFWRGVQITE